MSEHIRKLGWWCIPGEELLMMLRRVEAGEAAAIVYIKEYVNCTKERLEESED